MSEIVHTYSTEYIVIINFVIIKSYGVLNVEFSFLSRHNIGGRMATI